MFYKGVIRAVNSTHPEDVAAVEDLEPKRDLLMFFVGFHKAKRIMQKRIACVLRILLSLPGWRVAADADEELCAALENVELGAAPRTQSPAELPTASLAETAAPGPGGVREPGEEPAKRTGVALPLAAAVAKVAGCAGWAVHGLIFELTDGQRRGCVLDDDRQPMESPDVDERGGQWYGLFPGEVITKVSGHHDTGGYLAHSVVLHTQLRTINIRGSQGKWRGDTFAFEAEQGAQIVNCRFLHGRCTGVETSRDDGVMLPPEKLLSAVMAGKDVPHELSESLAQSLKKTTSDTCRFAKTKELPLVLQFETGCGSPHSLTLAKREEVQQMVATCSGEITWRGDEVDRTKLPAQANLALLTFRYVQSSMWHSHGIEVEVQAFDIPN